MLPAAVTVAGPVFVIDRSADAVTVVGVDDVLFARFGSDVAAPTVAELVSEAACAGAVTTTVMVGAVAPVGRTGRVHVTETLPLLVQTQPAPVAETNVTPLGSTSVTDIAAASDGPALATTRE